MRDSDRQSEESETVRRLMRDIVALVTLPAVWAGYTPMRIVEGFADVVLRTLPVDLIYARLKVGLTEDCVEVVRSSQLTDPSELLGIIADAVGPYLKSNGAESIPVINNPLGDGTLRLAITRFGCVGDVGYLVVGSKRADFPNANDRLLLSVGANQTTVVLQQKELEHSLNDQRERLRVTLSSIGDAVITTDTSGRVTSVNPVAESLTGWRDQDAAGRPLDEVFRVVHEGTRQPVTNPVHTVLAEGRTVGLANHTILIAKDGTEIPIDDSAAPIRDSTGTILGVVLTFRDIRERRRAEAAQAEQMRLTALRADVSSALSSRLSMEGALQECCEALVRHLGVAFARIWAVVEDEDVLQLQASAGMYTHLDGPHSRIRTGDCNIGRIVKSGVPHSTNDMLNDPNISDTQWAERERMIAFAGYPLLIEERAVGVVAIFSRSPLSQAALDNLAPLAESIAIHIERRQTAVQLQEAARHKDEFLAMLAHELRNPLAPIRTGLDVLAMDKESSQRDIILLMKEQVEHLVRLVDDLLDVSRIIRGKVELKKEPVQLADLIQRAVKATRSMIDANRQHLTVSVYGQPLWLDADPVRLVQIIENLLSNASKYTDTGGKIELSSSRHDGSAVLCVKDNGMGIEAGLLPKVFDLFTQSERALDRAKGGLGIGLTLANRLVQMHGGTISVHSEGANRGSTFTVTLPLMDAPVEVVETPADTSDVPGRQVLIVDDNVAAAEMFSLLLTRLGDHQVRTAHDGRSALTEINRDPPEIVFLDIGLPGMDGYEVAARLREDRNHDHLLLVALTGYGQAEDRRKAKEAGFDEHLVKPPAMRDLTRLLMHPKLVGGSQRESREAAASSVASSPQQRWTVSQRQSQTTKDSDADIHPDIIHCLGNHAHMAGLAASILEKGLSSAEVAAVKTLLDELQRDICESAELLKKNTPHGDA